MPFQKVEYKFPDEDTNDNKNKNDTIEVEKSSAVEIDISGKASTVNGKPKEEKGQTEEKVETKETTKPKASAVVAPVTRTTSSKKIRLSTSQVNLAKKLGLTPEQYAKEMVRLENKNG